MSRVTEFLNEAKTYFVATTDGEQPKLRPFGGAMDYQDKVYISTNNTKNVYAQMKKNPKIEIVAMANGKWIRITGKAVEDTSVEARKEMLDSHPFLQKQYSLDDGIFTIFYIDEMKAVLNGFSGKSEEYTRKCKYIKHEKNKEKQGNVPDGDGKALVVYFSYSGNTKKLAEASEDARPKYKDLGIDIKDYDHIYIGWVSEKYDIQ